MTAEGSSKTGAKRPGPDARGAVPAESGPRPLLGAGLMAAASLLVPFVDGIAKHLAAEHSPFLVSWARYAVASLLVISVAVASSGGGLPLPRRGLAAHALRTAFMVGAATCFFSAIAEIPLATALGGYFLGPVIAAALAVMILGERATIVRTLAVGLGLAGALLVVRPGPHVEPGTFLALASGGLFAGYLITTRLAARSDPPLVTLAFQCLFGTLLLTPTALLNWSAPTAGDAILVGAMGLLSAVAHLLVIKAFRLAETSALAPLAYLELVTATLVGLFAFGELPGVWAWAGIALIMAGGLLVGTRRDAGAREVRARTVA